MTHPEPAMPQAAAVAAYAQELRRAHPSRTLDARIESAIRDAAAAKAGSTRRSSWRRLPAPALAAAITAVLVAGLVVWLALQRFAEPGSAPVASAEPTVPPPELASDAAQANADTIYGPAFAVASAGTYSLWPTEAAVFRLQTRLDAAMPATGLPGARGEQRFWVDVRIANDGSMRIVRIVPVDEGT